MAKLEFGSARDMILKVNLEKEKKKKKSEEAMPDEVFSLRYIFQLEVEDST